MKEKSEQEYKKEYNKLLNIGMFWEFYPQLSGNWNVDRNVFMSSEKLQDKIRNTMVNPTPPDNFATTEQSKSNGNGIDIISLVHTDLEERAKKGEETYGERLQPFNGRNGLIDAYQEALDLAIYLRQVLEEQKGLSNLDKRK